LNDFGKIANDQWIKLADRYPNFELDVFQIMPNHMHGIIMLNDVGAGFTPAPIANPNDTIGQPQGIAPTTSNENSQNTIGQPQGIAPTTTDENSMNTIGQPQGIATTVCDIIGAYKSLVANECLEIFKNKNPDIFMGKLWQRNYYEHIIRNEKSYKRISEYIINNPENWKGDKFFDE
jgi:REP element-mobilizing transposase RayT